MSAYAQKFGEDVERWQVTALLHDFDWEIHPNAPDHPMKGEAILAERRVEEGSGGPFFRMPTIAACRACRCWNVRCLPAMSFQGF